ncbi:eIF4G [Aphelenchoides avenae]|nr:eIF4G [Aphelenchus avenae]
MAVADHKSEANKRVQESSKAEVRKMKEHMARFHNPEVQAEFDANVYSRDFLYVLRNVVRELKLEKPAMPHSLEEVGLDRRGMPDPQIIVARLYENQCRYEGRGGNGRRQKKGAIEQPSKDGPQRRADLLKRWENTWDSPNEGSFSATEQKELEVPSLSEILQMIAKCAEKVPEPEPVQSRPSPPVNEKKVAAAVRATIDEYSMDVVTIDEAFEAVNELCQRTSVQVVFKKFFAYGGENAEQLNEDAIKGFTQYCTEAVEQELSGDCPGLWKNIARIIGWSMFCHSDNVDGPRPHMDIFMPVFKAANEESPKQFSVLVQVLQMMVEEIGNHEGMSEDDIVQPFNTAFDELRKADPAFYDSDDFKDALKKAECKLAAHPNLYSLLKPF